MTEIINKEAYNKLCTRDCNHQHLCDYDFCNIMWIAAEQAMLEKQKEIIDRLKCCENCGKFSEACNEGGSCCDKCNRGGEDPFNKDSKDNWQMR